ncbi:MAG TPA: ABC transporter substrate-binding protein [Solirubrobacteraceae bacterium]|nr:ABC transporter substrate-binding protein [Solirubrobacteraceae bacterium]
MRSNRHRGWQFVAAAAILSLAGCSGSGPSTDTSLNVPKADVGVISLKGCAPNQTASKYPEVGKTLSIAVSPLSPPYIFVNANAPGTIVGFDADFVAAWTRCLGVKYHWQVYQDFGAMIPAVQSGRANLVNSSVYATPERAREINFNVFMSSFTGSIVRKGNPKHITSLEDLCGRVDAQVVGAVEVPLVEAQSKRCRARGRPSVDLTIYNDNSLAIQAVLTGRADAFLADSAYAETVAKRFPAKVENAFAIPNGLTIGVGVNKDEHQLLAANLAAIKVLEANGTVVRLLKKWGLRADQQISAYSLH